MSGNKKLAEARILAAKQVPYMRAGLMSLLPVERPGLGTMAMDQYGRLYYDPTFLEARSPKHNAFVVIHEYVHYHQRHAQRQKAVVQRDPAKLEVWRGTVEGPTNEIVESCFGWCPEEATTSAKLGLPRNLTVEEAFAIKWKERCEREEEAERQQQQGPPGQEDADEEQNEPSQYGDADENDSGDDQEANDGDHDANDTEGEDEAGDEEGEGQESDEPGDEDGEGEGDNSDDAAQDDNCEVGDEPQDGQGETEGQEPGENGQDEGAGEDPASAGDGADGADDGRSAQGGQGEGATSGQSECQGTLSPEALSQLAQDIGGSACVGVQRPWEFGPPDDENPGLSESDQDMIEATIAKAIEAHVAARGEGSVAAALVKQANELLHKPVDPCRELAAMTKYAVDTIAGFGEFTYARPSNRQIPGGCLLPSSVKPIPRITLIIDSSGSMGSDDTALALEVLAQASPRNVPGPAHRAAGAGGRHRSHGRQEGIQARADSDFGRRRN